MENKRYLDDIQHALQNPLMLRSLEYVPEWDYLSPSELHVFENLEELRIYNADDTLLKKLNLAAFPKLRRLHLRSGAITELPVQVCACSHLEELHIGRQRLKSLPQELTKLTKLKKLHLKGLRYLRLLPEGLWQMPALAHVQIEKCPLKELPEISSAPPLEKLILKNTKIKALPKGLSKLSALHTLTLQESPLEQLSEELLALPLQKITLRELPFLDNLGQKGQYIASLWKSFAKKEYSFAEKKAFFYLFLGNIEAFAKLEEAYLLALKALYVPQELVRAGAQAFLYEHSTSPFQNSENVKLYLSGTFRGLEEENLKDFLREKGFAVSHRLQEEVSHLLLGDLPSVPLDKLLYAPQKIVAAGHLKDFLQAHQSFYLQESSTENTKAEEHLCELLESNNQEQISLALELVYAGGLSEQLKYELIAIYLLWDDNKLRKAVERVFMRHLPDTLFAHLKRQRRPHQPWQSPEYFVEYFQRLAQPELDMGRIVSCMRKQHKNKNLGALPMWLDLLMLSQDSAESEGFWNKAAMQACLKAQGVFKAPYRLPALSNTIGLMTELHALDLSESCIRKLPQSLQKLPFLREIDLSACKLEHFPEGLCTLPKLEVLRLGHNKLKQLPEEIGQLQKLFSLDLSHNQLRQIPEQLYELKQLHCLKLSHNPLGKRVLAALQERIKTALPNCTLVL
jgi:Leucine-rich repeat (LRR) protein